MQFKNAKSLKRIFFLFLMFFFFDSSSYVRSQEPNEVISSQIFDKFKTGLNYNDIESLFTLEEISVQVTLEGLKDFTKGKLHKFDPTAGDTCCQVRTNKTLGLDKDEDFKNVELPKIIEDLTLALAKIRKAKEELAVVFAIPGDMKKKADYKKLFFKRKKGKETTSDKENVNEVITSAQGFMKKFAIEYPKISEKALFVILSHFVTKYHSEINYILQRKKELLELTYDGMSSKGLHGLLYVARKKLSFLTNEHLGQLTKEVYEDTCVNGVVPSMTKDQVEDFSAYYQIMQDIGSMPPFESRSTFAGFQLIFADFWKKNIPMMLKVAVLCPKHGMHKVDFIYVKGPRPFEFVLYEGEPTEMMKKNMAIVEGVADVANAFGNQTFNDLTNSIDKIYADHSGPSVEIECPQFKTQVKKIQDANFSTMMMANSAKHPQYVDKNKTINFALLGEGQAKKQEEKFLKYCELAEGEGLCMEKMTLMRLTHIFPANASEAVGKVKIDTDIMLLSSIEAKLKKLKALKESKDDKKKRK